MYLPRIVIITLTLLFTNFVIFLDINVGQPAPAVGPSVTPTPLATKIRRGDEEVPLTSVLSRDEDSDLSILQLGKDQLVRFVLEPGTVLTSSDPQVFQVVDGTAILGLKKNGEATLTATRNGNRLNLAGLPSIIVRVEPIDEVRIQTRPEMLSYREVADRFGKGIARNYVVVQVDIKNNYAAKQFLVQDLVIVFDPAQCKRMADYFADIDPSSPNDSYQNKFDVTDCQNQFGSLFTYPVPISPIDRDAVLAVGNAEKYRSNRYRLFQTIRFLADVGTGLNAFKILGRDAITGFGFLGNGLFNAADAALPKIANEKWDNLQKGVPERTMIIPSADRKVVNVFIEADRVFNKDTWKIYKRSARDLTAEQKKQAALIKLFLTSTASGILVNNTAQTTTSPKGGGAESLVRESRRQ